MSTTSADVFWGEIAPCEHFLQFYESDVVLLDTLMGFIGGGLRIGDSAIVIATPDHLDALDRRLAEFGIDLPAALASDQYIPLDASETLERFMVDGWPDQRLFSATISDVLKRARRNGRRVRAFGEMVALLWARQQAAATVRLEHLWNKLCRKDEFSLFCAYPKTGVTQGFSESMGEICAAHSKVILAA